MDKAGYIFGLVCALALIWNRRKTKKILTSIEAMLDAAAAGSFSETAFDESRLSALETRFAHYLSASAISARNVALEKDKIQSLVSDISHQTKTPIANLLLYSELLMEQTLPPPARAYGQQLYEQSEKLRFLIDALVKTSRLENGIVVPVPRPGPLQPMLEAAAAQFAPLAAEKGLTLELKETDIRAVFDPKWTAEALGNLVDNAVKYTRQGGVVLSVTGYEMFARIDVRDTGVGIPESEQEKIFSRFYRGAAGEDQPGVGIGLYLARRILQDQGGYIKVASTPGNGSVFSVFLPKP